MATTVPHPETTPAAWIPAVEDAAPAARPAPAAPPLHTTARGSSYYIEDGDVGFTQIVYYRAHMGGVQAQKQR